MRYGSVCSGIEAATQAWAPLGWKASFFAEIKPFPRAVLSHRHPTTPLHGDFTTIEAGQYEPIDLLVGGTPCQSFSVAGLRGGLADERGNLALEYLRLAGRLRPRWLVWENVPGVFSATSHSAPDPRQPPNHMDEGAEWVDEVEYDSDESHAFACFLAGLSELGYGFAYRVLDAQFFGLAQRRKRVFVVGYLGDWRRATAVLFEPASLRGHPAPRRTAGEVAANALTERPDRGGGNSEGQRLVAATLDAVTGRSRGAGTPIGLLVNTLTNHHGRFDGESDTFVADVVPAISASNPYGDHESREGLLVAATLTQGAQSKGKGSYAGRRREDDVNLVANPLGSKKDAGWRDDLDDDTYVTHTLRADGFDASEDETGRGTPLVPCYAIQERAVCENVMAGSDRAGFSEPTLSQNPTLAAAFASAVRRLTPRECERLQGFPDDYTLIPFRGKPAADGPRYRALGNSMAVPCMAWIGQRIIAQEVGHDV